MDTVTMLAILGHGERGEAANMTPSFIGNIYIRLFRTYIYRGGDKDIHVSQLLIGSHHTVSSILLSTWAWVEAGEAHAEEGVGAEAA